MHQYEQNGYILSIGTVRGVGTPDVYGNRCAEHDIQIRAEKVPTGIHKQPPKQAGLSPF